MLLTLRYNVLTKLFRMHMKMLIKIHAYVTPHMHQHSELFNGEYVGDKVKAKW